MANPPTTSTFEERSGQVVAWLTFSLVTCSVGYLELINHRVIMESAVGGLIAHAFFFASLALSAFGVTGGRFRLAYVAAGVTVVAAALEWVEVEPTASGDMMCWIASTTGIWLAWLGARWLGRPRSDVGMATSALLWFCGTAAVMLF